jgi:phytoene/squalene synthetase
VKSEILIQREVMLAVGSAPGVIAYRNNQAFAEQVDEQTGRTRRFYVGLGPGTPDLVALVAVRVTFANGAVLVIARGVGLEVKSEDGAPEESQLRTQKQWHAVGAFYAFVRSADEARAAIARARLGALE